MIRLALRRIALPVAFALLLSLGACESTSDTGISEPGPPLVNDAPASPPSNGVSADAPLPVFDPTPPPSSSVSPPMAGAMKCDDSRGQTSVGQSATQAAVAKIIADTGSRNARVVKPGQAVTMDYREDRVNINVDAKNVVIAVKCG